MKRLWLLVLPWVVISSTGTHTGGSTYYTAGIAHQGIDVKWVEVYKDDPKIIKAYLEAFADVAAAFNAAHEARIGSGMNAHGAAGGSGCTNGIIGDGCRK